MSGKSRISTSLVLLVDCIEPCSSSIVCFGTNVPVFSGQNLFQPKCIGRVALDAYLENE